MSTADRDTVLMRPLPGALRLLPMLMVMGAIFFLSHQPGDTLQLPPFPQSDKVAHGIAYATLALTVFYVLSETLKQKRTMATLLVVAICTLYGFSDEFHQLFIPGRNASLADVLADCGGAVLASGFWLFRQRRLKR